MTISMDFPGRVLAAFLAIILITLFPLQYMANNIENSIDSHVDNCTEHLSDTIRTKGYLDTHTYETFVRKLDNLGEVYDIEIEDIHPVTGEEVVLHDDTEAVNMVYQNNEVKSHKIKPMKNNVASFKLGNSIIDKDISEVSNDIRSLATHTHTEACFAGHRHISSCYYIYNVPTGGVTGSFVRGYAPYGVNPIIELRYSDGSLSLRFSRNIRTDVINIMDYRSGSEYYCADFAPGDPLYSMVNSYLNDSFNRVEAATGITIPLTSGVRISVRPGYIPQISIPTCTLVQDETPICNQVVTSITPTNPTQIVDKGANIITTANATYLDGHIGIVNCTSNFNPNLVGTQNVTLAYSGLVGNAKTTGTRTCTINVTVIDKSLSYITASPPSQTIIKNGTPIFSVKAYYSDGTSADIASNLCTVSSFSNTTVGQKNVTISYTEGGITKSTTIIINVDDIVSIVASPAEITVERYTKASMLPITITAKYYYGGTKIIPNGYTVSSYNPSAIGNQNITISYSENGGTYSTIVLVHITPLHKVCSVCGSIYDMNSDDSDPGCPICKYTAIGISVTPDEIEVFQGGSLPITVHVLYRDGKTRIVTGWTSTFSPNTVGLQLVEVRYGGYRTTIYVNVKQPEVTCPICGTTYPSSEGRCPVCSEKVISIKVLPDEITVHQYDVINLTVTANYADGSAREVNDWSIDCSTSSSGTFTANVSYGGCTYPIKLIVLSSNMVTCSICGLSYDSGKFPNGCPVCSKQITGIEAYLTSGSKFVQYGTTPNISVVLIFRDMHREITDVGFSIENYNPYEMGTQTIKVVYNEFSYLIDIEVTDNLLTVVCPKGHVYYLNGDGTDPGCPYCTIATSYEVVYYYDITYTYEILEEIYKNGVYYFDKNNFLNISVTKKDVSILKKLQKFTVKTVLLARRKRFNYGGKIS